MVLRHRRIGPTGRKAHTVWRIWEAEKAIQGEREKLFSTGFWRFAPLNALSKRCHASRNVDLETHNLDYSRMAAFATEFPVKRIAERGTFLAQVISWLQGTNYSTVFDNPINTDLGGDWAQIETRSGEELRLREFRDDTNVWAMGFRHDFPDGQGRLWRTEAVLRRAKADVEQDIIRLRTQCIAQDPNARLEAPRKPYLVKAMLRDQWGGLDRELSVSDQPHWLGDSGAALATANTITNGGGTHYLPVVYISAIGPENWLLSKDQIEKLAYDLGGVAHVAVESTRAFSFRLRDMADGRNAYGGTIGIAIPGRGLIRRFFLGIHYTDLDELQLGVRTAAIAIRGEMPAEGWDWTELQEQALRYQRVRDRKRLSDRETIELYEGEVENLKDRINQLEAQISTREPTAAIEIDEGLLPALLVSKIGPEIYPGEFSDRIRLAVRECAARAELISLDKRSAQVFQEIAAHLPTSAALSELREDLKRATKDPKRVTSEMVRLLSRHGYREKSDNKHVRLQAMERYVGLDTITIPKTPSDARGLINLRKQIERTLGLNKLPD
jgi:hypothetical protein